MGVMNPSHQGLRYCCRRMATLSATLRGACHEKQSQFPPMHVLTALTSAVGISTQEFMGEKDEKAGPEPRDVRIGEG